MARRRDGNLNKVGLISQVARDTNVPIETVNKVLMSTLTTIGKTVVANRKVVITNFGTFYSKTVAGQCRNPATGDPIDKPPTQRMHFRVSRSLRDALRKGDPEAVVIKKKGR